MVRIINYKKRQTEDKEFFVLEVTGGIEMVMSKTTGQFYATSKKAYVSSTFDEQTCKALIGTELAGNVEKQECEGYEYTVKDTGEVITLNHRYVYTPEIQKAKPETKPIYEDFIPNTEVFSKNGKAELEYA